MNFGNLLMYTSLLVGLYVTIFFLITILENRRRLHQAPLKGKTPSVSFIVPCYNEEKNIVQTIESLLALDYPKNKLQILVIDDGSKDKTFEKAKALEVKGLVKVYHKKNGGKHTALNYGLAKIQSKFVGTLDADSFVDPQALKKMLPYFADSNVQAVTSSLKVYQPKSIWQHLQNAEYLLGIYFRKAASLLGSLNVTPGPLTIFRRSIFEKIGNYHRAYQTEDCEMALRLQSYNFQIENTADACVYTVAPNNFKTLYRQRVRWYQGTLRNTWDYRRLFGRKQGNLGLLVLPASFFGIFLLLTIASYSIINTTTNLLNSFFAWQAINFDLSQFSLNWDWFLVSLNLLTLLGITSLFLTALAMLVGQKLSRENFSWKTGKGMFLALLLYIPLYSLWWLGAITQVVFHRQPNWTLEKEKANQISF